MQGVDPRMIVGVTTEVISAEGLIADRRRNRYPCPLHLPAAGIRRAGQRPDLAGRRRNRARDGHLRHDLLARRPSPAHDAPGHGRLADEFRLSRQGEFGDARGPGRTTDRRGDRFQAARRLGHDPGRHRLLFGRRRRVRRAGGHSHRHAQRIGICRGVHRRLQGPHDSHLSLRRGRRRPRARHPAGLRRTERLAQLHQSHPARSRSIRSTSIWTC